MCFDSFDEVPAELRQTGIATRTEVHTAHGSTPVGDLEPGDSVLTDQGFQPLRRIERQPAVTDNDLRAIRVAEQPLGDEFGLQIAPYQMVRVQDWRLTEMFGLPEAGVEARFLIGWRGVASAVHECSHFYKLVFDEPTVVWAIGGRFICASGAAYSDSKRRSAPPVLTAAQARAWRSWTAATLATPAALDRSGAVAGI